jgi:hypothetical protein
MELMTAYTYKVIPFAGQAKSSRIGEVSNQLQGLINRETSDGWEFYQLGNLNIEASPGCIAALFGAKNVYIQLDQLIFRRPV